MVQGQQGLAIGERARPWYADFPAWLVAPVIGAIALIPRTTGLADFFTIDEAYVWIDRVRMFMVAIHAHQWAKTDLTGHPGVTTMWLGGIGREIAQLLGVPDEHGVAGPTTAYLALLRLPLAVTNSIVVAISYILLRRLLRPDTALLAALLWATSPFLLAFSRLLHVDALVTSFSTLSILLLLLATGDRHSYAPSDDQEDTSHPRATTASGRAAVSLTIGRWSLVGSGVCAGLATLSKSSGLILLPWAGLLLLAAVVNGELRGSDRLDLRLRVLRERWMALLGRTIAWYLLWLGCAILTFVAIWPAMWVAPARTFGDFIDEIVKNGAQPHELGNYFLGREMLDPGLLFYPVVVVLRSRAVVLLGLLALPLTWQRSALQLRERRLLVALLGFIFLFGLAVSIAAKKFDRYLLPAWPALELLAAIGLVTCGRRVGAWLRSRSESTRLTAGLRPVAMLVLVAMMLAIDIRYHPYYLAYYNPLLGGGATAERVMLVGWGEGMEQIGAWLQGRPDIERGPVLSWIGPTLQPFLPPSVQVLERDSQSLVSNYAVVYARGAVRELTPVSDSYIAVTPPLYTLRRYGITYASVYQLPIPYNTPLNALFGDGLLLRGYSQQQIGSTLVITPSWNVLRDQPGHTMVFIHVLALDGRHIAQFDTPIDGGLFSSWQAGQQFGTALPIGLPPDLPDASYRIVLGVYRADDGSRLALSQSPALPDSVDGPNAILLSTLIVKKE